MTEEERPGVVKWARSFWDRTKDAVYIGGVVAGIIVGVLKWYQETFPPVVPVTSGEMAEQFDELRGNLAAFAYRDSLYRDSLRMNNMNATPPTNPNRKASQGHDRTRDTGGHGLACTSR